jgi:hypothetical protein
LAWDGGEFHAISYKPLMCLHVSSTHATREQNIPTSFDLWSSTDATRLPLPSKFCTYKYFLVCKDSDHHKWKACSGLSLPSKTRNALCYKLPLLIHPDNPWGLAACHNRTKL